MGRDLRINLEYDGENPIRNTFLCGIDSDYFALKKWEDLYGSGLDEHSGKKHSLQTLESSGNFGCHSWGIKKIDRKIEEIKREIELDTDLDKNGKLKLHQVINDLQSLKDAVIEKCKERNINPEKCYIVWWLDF